MIQSILLPNLLKHPRVILKHPIPKKPIMFPHNPIENPQFSGEFPLHFNRKFAIFNKIYPYQIIL